MLHTRSVEHLCWSAFQAGDLTPLRTFGTSFSVWTGQERHVSPPQSTPGVVSHRAVCWPSGFSSACRYENESYTSAEMFSDGSTPYIELVTCLHTMLVHGIFFRSSPLSKDSVQGKKSQACRALPCINSPISLHFSGGCVPCSWSWVLCQVWCSALARMVM